MNIKYSVVYILIFTIMLSCSSYAEPALTSTIETALDEIGLGYKLFSDGAEIIFTIDGQEYKVAVFPSGDQGDLSLAYRLNEGVHILRCSIDANCRGGALKAAIWAFVTASKEFKSSYQKFTVEFAPGATKSGSTTASSATELTDFNIIPAQYRESDSKVKAWLKQQGYYGKTVSIKARVYTVRDSHLIFIFDYNDTQNSLMGSSLIFRVTPKNYSPLDYNEKDAYIVSGQMEEDISWTFQLSNPILQRAK